MSMDKLIELHDAVKLHPYRIDQDRRKLSTYQKLLFALSHEFYVSIKDTKYHTATNMIHDFNGSIMNIGRENFEKWINDEIAHVEQCIGVIHQYIDTQTVPAYYTFYKGVNILKNLPRHMKYQFNDETGKYKLVLSVIQAKKCLHEIQSHYRPFPPKKWDEWGLYAEYQYQYFKELAEDK